MDPFDELAGLSASGAHSRQQPLSNTPFQQPSGAASAATQLASNTSAMPSMAKGNPFVDTLPKAANAPARARAGPTGAFQVLLSVSFQ